MFVDLFPGAPQRFLDRIAPSGDCIVWTGRTQKDRGYGLMWYQGRTLGTHRIAFALAHGPIPDGLVVMHRCDNPPCVNPAHLQVGSHADNQHDKVRKHRQAKGSRQGHAKLSEAAVLDIRARVAAGDRQCDLARAYGVSACTINDIVKRRWWKAL